MSQSALDDPASWASNRLGGRPLLARYLSILRWLRVSALAASAAFFSSAIRMRASSVVGSKPDEAWPAGPADGAWTLMNDG